MKLSPIYSQVTWSGTDQLLWLQEKIFGVNVSENISTQFGLNIIIEEQRPGVITTGKAETIGDTVTVILS